MDTQVVKRVPILTLVVITVWIVLSFSHPTEVFAEPLPAPRPVDIPPCTLPSPVTTTPPETGPFSLHPGEAAPNLVISCLRFHRSHYQVFDTWQASMTVQNVGTGSTGGTVDVHYSLCRWPEGQDEEACIYPAAAAAVIPEMAPGTSQVIQFSGEFEFYPDANPGYDSWIAGIPNNMQIWIRAFLSQSGETMASAVTQAVYPSGLDYQVAGDEDGDGWAPPGDCDDSNPNMYPHATEIVGNGVDEDCAGGDRPAGTYGCDEPVEEIYEYGNPPYPPCDGPPGSPPYDFHDYDDDTWYALEPGGLLDPGFLEADRLGDCDDFNAAVYPGAPELLEDGLDNNCNGLIDEGSATPDWVIDSFTLFRDTEPYALNAYQELMIPGLRYEVSVGNQGDYLGEDFSAVPVNLSTSGQGIVASGTSRFLYYNWLQDGAEFACRQRGFEAEVSPGIFYETNTTNNDATVVLNQIDIINRAVSFASDPELLYEAGMTEITISTNSEAVGTCPPLPTFNGNEYIPGIWRMTVNGDSVNNESAGSFSPLSTDWIANLSQPLSNHDIVCLEITLDPLFFIIEDHSDNLFVGVFEYRDPFIGQSRFDVMATAYGPAGATWSIPGDICGGIGSTQGALTTGGGAGAAAIVGLILVSLAGGGIGLLGGRRLAPSRTGLILLTAGGMILGGFGGWVAGDAIASNQLQRLAAIELETVEGEPSLIPSCDLYLDHGSAIPADGTAFEYGVETLPLSISLVEVAQPAPSVLEMILTSPTGREAIVPVAVAEDGITFHLDLAGFLFQQGSDLLYEEGDFGWSILSMYHDPGGDVLPLQPLCQGSSEHSFTILPEPAAAPTDTPTVTTEPPTLEPATAEPDTQGPSVSGVGDSPDPVFTNGNPPDTSTVSATVTDPSGVASVTLYYSDAGKTTFQVWGPMSGSGGSYSTAFGPFGSAGAYQYRIYAVDSLGNANCSTSNINACPGGTLTVIIP